MKKLPKAIMLASTAAVVTAGVGMAKIAQKNYPYTDAAFEERMQGAEDISNLEVTNSFDVATADEFKAALQAARDADSGVFEINLTADINGNGFGVYKNTVIVKGNGHTITTGGPQAFVIYNPGILYLGGDGTELTVIGGRTGEGPGMIYNWGGVLNIYDGVTLKGQTTNNYFGGGISCRNGVVNMYGGVIEDCHVDGGSVNYGGGIGLYSNATLNMYGGTIKDCSAETTYSTTAGWQIPSGTGGGVYVGYRSTFNMSGGTIENCSASSSGGGVMVQTSVQGYYDFREYGHLDSCFNMTGGTIKNCSSYYTGGGVSVIGTYDRAYTMAASFGGYSKLEKEGIFIDGGTIEGCDSGNGGGIFLNWIRPTIPVEIKNATFTGNEADQGGAIDILSNWTQALIEGCTIDGNESLSSGGGICITGNGQCDGTTIKDCTIINNTSKDYGAGVYYDEASRLSITGANVIQDNTFDGAPSNLHVVSFENPVRVIGDLTGSRIGLSDPTLWGDELTDEDPTAVSTDKLTEGFKTYNSELPEKYFTSDHNTWVPYYGDKEEETYTTEEKWAAMTYGSAKYNQYVYGIAQTGGTTGQVQLYFDLDTGKLTTTKTNYAATLYEVDGSKYYIGYKESTSVYKSLGEVEYQAGTTRNYAIPSNLLPDGGISTSAGNVKYARCGSYSNNLSYKLQEYSVVQTPNGDGYDYSNEVKLVRIYNVTLHLYDNEVDDSLTTYLEGVGATLPTEETRTGYTFKGWYDNADFSGEPVTEITTEDKGNKEFFAKWEANKVNLTVNYIDLKDNYAIEEATVTEVAYDTDYDTTKKEFDGYEFIRSTENTTGKVGLENIEVTYYYKKIAAPVTIKYVDVVTGKELVDSVTKEGLEGDEYTSQKVTVDGYVFESDSGNTSGQMTTSPIEVVYNYRKQVKVTAKYVDEINGTEISKVETTYGEEADYETEQKTFELYEYTRVEGTTSGKVGPENIEVTYYYKLKSAGVIVKYVDILTGADISEQVQKTGLEGDTFTAQVKEIPGYVLNTKPENETVTFTTDVIILTYSYNKVSGGLKVQYVDNETGDVLKEYTESGNVGDDYTTSKETFEKYDFVDVEGEVEGKLADAETVVTYKYKKKIGKVQVKYVDAQGNVLLEEEMSGKVDEDFEVEIKEVEKYEVEKLPEELSGVYELEDQEIVIVLRKKKVIYYFDIKDEEGNVIDVIEIEAYPGEEIEIDLTDIEGYEKPGDGHITIKIPDDGGKGEAIYKKIVEEESPNTGDPMLAALAMFGLSASGIGIYKKKKEDKENK